MLRARISLFGLTRSLLFHSYLAEATVWLTIVCILATFDISKAVDENGNVIEPDPEFLSSFLRSVPTLTPSHITFKDAIQQPP